MGDLCIRKVVKLGHLNYLLDPFLSHNTFLNFYVPKKKNINLPFGAVGL